MFNFIFILLFSQYMHLGNDAKWRRSRNAMNYEADVPITGPSLAANC